MELLERRAGVPVFNRPKTNPSRVSELLNLTEAGSPTRPAGYELSPSLSQRR
jgi:hypothetical protein